MAIRYCLPTEPDKATTKMRLFAWEENGCWMVFNDQLQRVYVTNDERLAKLLAAAPELLKACNSAHKCLSAKHRDDDKILAVLGLIIRALKKAQ